MKRSMILLTALAILLEAGLAFAQDYPVRPIRVIAAQGPGSSLDTLLRIIVPGMSEILGQQLVVDNRGGAGGMMGVEAASRAAPDGYTFLVGARPSMIISTFTYPKLTFDARKDFEPISMTADAHAVLVVPPNLPVKSVKELIALAKAQPGKLNMASAGVGSSSHLGGVLFNNMAGIKTVHVPYKGGGAAATAVIAGEAQWTLIPAAAVAGHVQAGRLRAIGISSRQRSPLTPDMPTIDEAGVSGYEYGTWNGFFAPKGTPRAVINKVHAAIQSVLADPGVKKLYATQGLVPQGSASPEEFRKHYLADFDQIARIVKIAGLKPE
jgi:tripartite-type tricarboxylate transporter receptor subunit TctC